MIGCGVDMHAPLGATGKICGLSPSALVRYVVIKVNKQNKSLKVSKNHCIQDGKYLSATCGHRLRSAPGTDSVTTNKLLPRVYKICLRLRSAGRPSAHMEKEKEGAGRHERSRSERNQ